MKFPAGSKFYSRPTAPSTAVTETATKKAEEEKQPIQMARLPNPLDICGPFRAEVCAAVQKDSSAMHKESFESLVASFSTKHHRTKYPISDRRGPGLRKQQNPGPSPVECMARVYPHTSGWEIWWVCFSFQVFGVLRLLLVHFFVCLFAFFFFVFLSFFSPPAPRFFSLFFFFLSFFFFRFSSLLFDLLVFLVPLSRSAKLCSRPRPVLRSRLGSRQDLVRCPLGRFLFLGITWWFGGFAFFFPLGMLSPPDAATSCNEFTLPIGLVAGWFGENPGFP